MLRTYGPACDGSVIEAKAEKIPDTATWVDLEEPTVEEEALVERCIRMDVPTESEMAEIEPSSRLYERDGALYMTVSVLYGVQDGDPRTAPISFVLTDNRLVTVRYATPKPLRAFTEHARRDPTLVKDAPTALVRMLDSIIDRFSGYKIISLTFETPGERDFSALGEVLQQTPLSVQLKVPRAKVTETCRQVLAECAVVDINVQELPVEEVIRQLFGQRDQDAAAAAKV